MIWIWFIIVDRYIIMLVPDEDSVAILRFAYMDRNGRESRGFILISYSTEPLVACAD